jgi:hypothetical protein
MLGKDEPIGQLTLDGSLRPHSSSTQMSAPACTEQDGGRRTYSIPILYLGPAIKDGSQRSGHMPVSVTQRCFKRAKWRQIVDTATLAFSLLDRFWTPQNQMGIFIGQSAAALARILIYQLQEPRNRCRPRQSAENRQPSIEFFHSAELYCSILLPETAPASVLRVPSDICSPGHSPVPDILAESRCRALSRGLATPNLLSPLSPHLDLPPESFPSRRIHVAHASLQCLARVILETFEVARRRMRCMTACLRAMGKRGHRCHDRRLGCPPLRPSRHVADILFTLTVCRRLLGDHQR